MVEQFLFQHSVLCSCVKICKQWPIGMSYYHHHLLDKPDDLIAYYAQGITPLAVKLLTRAHGKVYSAAAGFGCCDLKSACSIPPQNNNIFPKMSCIHPPTHKSKTAFVLQWRRMMEKTSEQTTSCTFHNAKVISFSLYGDFCFVCV